mgnify:CR=1 FL=1
MEETREHVPGFTKGKRNAGNSKIMRHVLSKPIIECRKGVVRGLALLRIENIFKKRMGVLIEEIVKRRVLIEPKLFIAGLVPF